MNVLILLLIFLHIIFLGTLDLVYGLSCKNEKGNFEDWFIVYKIPSRKHELNLIKAGSAYAYMTDTSIKAKPGWLLSYYEINDEKNSILAKTLDEVYKNSTKFSYIQYNDDKPNDENNYLGYAHSKGILVWDNKDAFWILHSIPKFSSKFVSKKFNYPNSGKKYGQNVLCITMNSQNNIPKILNQLVIMEIQVYSANLQSDLNSNFKNLIKNNYNLLQSTINKSNKPISAKLTSKHSEIILPNGRLQELTQIIKSKKGKVFKSFAKNKKDFVDLYFGMVAVSYGVKEMNVKFWKLFQKKESILNSTCTFKEKVKNINNIKLSFINKPNLNPIEWGNNDHSKWGICNDNSIPCYCAGDLNRAISQMRRGGGLVCLLDSNIRDVFRNSFTTKNGCNNELEII